jgi:ketosteroid isomerase-like protein
MTLHLVRVRRGIQESPSLPRDSCVLGCRLKDSLMRDRHLRDDAEGVSDGPIEKESEVSLENEKHIRNAYQAAEEKDIEAFIGCFTDDGTFTDQSIGVTYRGTHIGDTVTNYGTAFPDMHRELYQFYSTGNIVVVQLALQGTHLGPLKMPGGTIPPTGKRMDAPCADVFELVDGKIKRFDCYPSGTVALTQLGVLDDLSAAFA